MKTPPLFTTSLRARRSSPRQFSAALDHKSRFLLPAALRQKWDTELCFWTVPSKDNLLLVRRNILEELSRELSGREARMVFPFCFEAVKDESGRIHLPKRVRELSKFPDRGRVAIIEQGNFLELLPAQQ